MSQSSLRDVLVDVPEALNVGFLIERFQRVYHDQFPDDCVVQLRSVDVFVSVLTLPWTYTLSSVMVLAVKDAGSFDRQH